MTSAGMSDGVLEGCGDAVEEFADFVDGQGYQFGFGLVISCPFFRGIPGDNQKSGGGHGQCDCRYQAWYRRAW